MAVPRGDVHAIRVGSRSNVPDNAVPHGQRGVWAVVTEGARIPAGSLVAGVPGTVRRALNGADPELIQSYARNC